MWRCSLFLTIISLSLSLTPISSLTPHLQLDCWDGQDGEPVIYHGWTLTSKLLFKVEQQGTYSGFRHISGCFTRRHPSLRLRFLTLCSDPVHREPLQQGPAGRHGEALQVQKHGQDEDVSSAGQSLGTCCTQTLWTLPEQVCHLRRT